MNHILDLMRQHKVDEAYNQLLPLLQKGSQAEELFIELFRTAANLFLLQDYAEDFEREAKAGNPWMQYAYARYHDCVQPESQSNAIMEEYYLKADQAGIADAHMCLAFCWRDGDLGLVNRENYARMRNEAVERGSHMAVQQQLRDMLWGTGGYERDPWNAYEVLDKFVRQSEEKGEHFDPRYLHVLADIAEELGRMAEADLLYEKAVKGGDVNAWYWLMLLRCGNKEAGIENLELFETMQDEGSEINAPEAFTSMQLYMNSIDFDECSEELKADGSKMLRDHLELGWDLGDKNAAFYMGYNHYFAKFGFEEDNAEAWKWFARAALLRSYGGYTMMAQMIKEGNAPADYDEEFQHICELRALRLGDSDQLENVVDAYKHGFLTDYALELEKYYLPEYEAKEKEDGDEDEPDEGDDGRYDAWA